MTAERDGLDLIAEGIEAVLRARLGVQAVEVMTRDVMGETRVVTKLHEHSLQLHDAMKTLRLGAARTRALMAQRTREGSENVLQATLAGIETQKRKER